MNPIDLIRLQITLEYDLDKAGRLVPFPGSTEQGLYIVYRYPGGYIPYFNQCLPEALCERLRNLGGEQAFEAPQAVVWLMQRYLPCHYEGRFVSEYLPRLSEPREFLQVVKQDEQFVVLDGDKPVCRAWSERRNAQCAKVGGGDTRRSPPQGFCSPGGDSLGTQRYQLRVGGSVQPQGGQPPLAGAGAQPGGGVVCGGGMFWLGGYCCQKAHIVL